MIHVVHHPGYVGPPRAGSPHAYDKHGLVAQALRDRAADGRAALAWHLPEPMPRAWIEAVHDPHYVTEVIEARVPPAKARRIGFAVTPFVARRAQLVPGGTWTAAQLALVHGFAANTAGGSHHALYDTGAGYCVVNDLAIAANRLIEEGDARRILILDCDVHQGDGTAALAAGRPELFTLSIHAERNFPARKARSSRDVGLADGLGDDAYLAILADELDAAIDGFGPDLILYQAGVDVHGEDRLGRLALSDAGLAARERLVANTARHRGLPLASALGGGYGEDLARVADRHALSIVTLGQSYADGTSPHPAGKR